MKKVLLLLAGTLSIAGAQAQYAKNNSMLFNSSTRRQTVAPENVAPANSGHRVAAKTTAATIATETFGTGTPTSLPTGWTAGSFSGTGKWHWSNTAPTSTYSGPMGAMHSTTAANGWMIYDSDSIGGACSCAPSGWLQSPAYNCTGHTTVRLNFENYYEHWQDSCVIWVSTNPAFSSYTSFPVVKNNKLGNGISTPNTNQVHVNITSAAAGQATVYIRFVYYCYYVTGGYAWMVDDMSLTELNPHDVSNTGSFMYNPDATAYDGSIFNTPLQFVDSVYPVTLLGNLGANAESSVVTTAKIYQGSTNVYTQNNTYGTLPLNAVDSIVQFPAYLPNAVGSYICTFNTALTNDSDMTNNVDTARFAVTDTTWMVNQGANAGSLYLHHSGTSPVSYMEGARFDVPSTAVGDTVSGFGVAFSSASLPTGTGTVSVQLYSIQSGGTGWTYVGASSVARPITTADISTSTSTVWADFRIDPVVSGGYGNFILQPGTTYAAIVQTNNVTTDLLVRTTVAPNATGFGGYFGQSDTSLDNGAANFSPASIATGNPSSVPMVRMYFGHVPVDRTGVNEVSTINTVGTAYPNPANTEVNIPFVMAQDANVKITLTNMVGQVVKTQNIKAAAGQSLKATFATSDLAAGIYIYNVEANGQHTNGRISVAH